MQYNPKNKALSVSVKDADRAASYLLAAIHYFRESHGLPREGLTPDQLTKRPALPMPSGDTCEYCILGAADALGIDLGATRPGQLDVREYR